MVALAVGNGNRALGDLYSAQVTSVSSQCGGFYIFKMLFKRYFDMF